MAAKRRRLARASDKLRTRSRRPAARRTVHRLRMPSERRAIPVTVERILRLLKPLRLAGDQRDDLAVALSEALSNAAVHGNKLRPGASVTIRVEVEPRRGVVVQVSDSGAGFDHSRLPDPSEPGQLLLPAGRGVFLMRRLVDGIEYNERGNEVRMLVKRRDAGEGQR
jgi:anti-sigma regulatory factor (Ser/Thr protein kinase)